MKHFTILKNKLFPQIKSIEMVGQKNNPPLTILITSAYLSGYSGSELVVRDLALGFKKLGHFPMVYSPKLGGVSQQILAENVPVVNDLAALPKTPDIIHGNHHLEIVQAALLFQNIPMVFVCHSRFGFETIPPQLDQVLAYVAVDYFAQERLVKDFSIPETQVEVIYNWVDMERFKPIKELSKVPQRALVFSSYAQNDSKLQEIKLACEACNLPLDIVGFGVGKGLVDPEKTIGQYDIVFAKAKCALEALASGAAVIVCDKFGLGEMVTTENVAEFRKWNFGLSLLTNPLKSANIVKEIKKYDAKDAKQVTQFIRAEVGLEHALQIYLQFYKKIIHQNKNKTYAVTSNSITKYAEKLLLRINYLETCYYEPFKMLPLTKELISQLKLDWVEYPAEVKSNKDFSVTVKIYNGSSERLGSYLPYPVYLSYFWLQENKDPYPIVSLRSKFEPWLECQSQTEQQILIRPPQDSGRFYLIVSLVQEEIFWFNLVDPSLGLSTLMTVSNDA